MHMDAGSRRVDNRSTIDHNCVPVQLRSVRHKNSLALSLSHTHTCWRASSRSSGVTVGDQQMSTSSVIWCFSRLRLMVTDSHACRESQIGRKDNNDRQPACLREKLQVHTGYRIHPTSVSYSFLQLFSWMLVRSEWTFSPEAPDAVCNWLENEERKINETRLKKLQICKKKTNSTIWTGAENAPDHIVFQTETELSYINVGVTAAPLGGGRGPHFLWGRGNSQLQALLTTLTLLVLSLVSCQAWQSGSHSSFSVACIGLWPLYDLSLPLISIKQQRKKKKKKTQWLVVNLKKQPQNTQNQFVLLWSRGK